jgi:hypothetical protein
MEDLLEQANEVQESLGRSYAVPDELDEADLEAGMSREYPSHPLSLIALAELDALGLEEEDEGPSYLSELNKAPDFVDEAPVEEVSSFWSETAHTLSPLVDVEQRGCSGIQLICRKASLRSYICYQCSYICTVCNVRIVSCTSSSTFVGAFVPLLGLPRACLRKSKH